jgi:tryptophanyl-tRNA synthetase
LDAGKKIIFSGMQPTGEPHLGNYLGALKNWASLQDSDEYFGIYSIVDMHSITVRQEPAELRKKARNLFMSYMAVGIDPEKSLLYFQSHVPGHAELAWILNCFTYMGELSRMTQYKEKSLKHADNINAGLFTYPVLMAADILLYGSHLVPIGDDQRQHMELCRDIAHRFNTIYGDVFVIPEGYYPKAGARVMGLQEPVKKMSKSDSANESNVVFLSDDPDTIMSKFKRAVTDSGSEVKAAEDKPGITNLLAIYCAVTKKSLEAAESEFASAGYGDFKKRVGEAVVEELRPIQQKLADLAKNKDYVDSLIKANAEKATAASQRILRKAKRKVGYPV